MKATYPGRKSLTAIADDMVGDVRSGIPRAVVKLARGLTLTLTFKNDVYTLTCGRREIFPSATELAVVAGAFGLSQAEWEAITIQEWRCYRYAWTWVTLDSLVGKQIMQ